MLVLLIIFMITAPLMTHKVKVELPEANLDSKPKTGQRVRADHARDQGGRLAATGTTSGTAADCWSQPLAVDRAAEPAAAGQRPRRRPTTKYGVINDSGARLRRRKACARSASSPTPNARLRTGEQAMAFASNSGGGPDGRHQRHAPRGRDAGAADHLHGDRAARCRTRSTSTCRSRTAIRRRRAPRRRRCASTSTPRGSAQLERQPDAAQHAAVAVRRRRRARRDADRRDRRHQAAGDRDRDRPRCRVRHAGQGAVARQERQPGQDQLRRVGGQRAAEPDKVRQRRNAASGRRFLRLSRRLLPTVSRCKLELSHPGPAYSASPISAWPIETSATSGTAARKAPRLAWLRSWPALTPRPSACAWRAVAAQAASAASASPAAWASA